jgi:hypothetical protein
VRQLSEIQIRTEFFIKTWHQNSQARTRALAVWLDTEECYVPPRFVLTGHQLHPTRPLDGPVQIPRFTTEVHNL